MHDGSGIAECQHSCVEQVVTVGFDEFADFIGAVFVVHLGEVRVQRGDLLVDDFRDDDTQ